MEAIGLEHVSGADVGHAGGGPGLLHACKLLLAPPPSEVAATALQSCWPHGLSNNQRRGRSATPVGCAGGAGGERRGLKAAGGEQGALVPPAPPCIAASDAPAAAPGAATCRERAAVLVQQLSAAAAAARQAALLSYASRRGRPQAPAELAALLDCAVQIDALSKAMISDLERRPDLAGRLQARSGARWPVRDDGAAGSSCGGDDSHSRGEPWRREAGPCEASSAAGDDDEADAFVRLAELLEGKVRRPLRVGQCRRLPAPPPSQLLEGCPSALCA